MRIGRAVMAETVKRQVIDSRLEASMIIDAAGMQKGVVLGEWA